MQAELKVNSHPCKQQHGLAYLVVTLDLRNLSSCFPAIQHWIFVVLSTLTMYSSSNSFLGGGNSSRPGPPQYGQSSFPNLQPTQQQSNGSVQQPTGFGGGPLQSQYTGYPGQVQQQNFQAPLQQPQFTGYPASNQQAAQSQVPQQQPFQTGQPVQPQVALQKTGQTSAQIAQSFQSTSAAQSSAPQTPVKGAKIPKIRLSFLTAQDQAKFEQLFKSAVGDGQALDGRIWQPMG